MAGRLSSLVALLMLTGLAAAVGLVLPALTGVIFARAIPAADTRLVGLVLAGLAGAAVLAAALEFARSLTLLDLMQAIDRMLSGAVMDRLLAAEPRLFRRFAAGDLATRIGDVELIHRVLGPSVVGLVTAAGFLVANLGFMAWVDGRLALLACALVLVIAWWSNRYAARQIRWEAEAARVDAALVGFVQQAADRREMLRAAAATDRAMARWRQGFAEHQAAVAAAQRADNTGTAINAAFGVLAPAVLFAAVVLLPDPPDLAQFLAFYAAFGQFLFAVLVLAGGALTLSRLVVPLARLKPLIDAPAETAAGRPPVPRPFAGLAVEGLRFRYGPDAPWVVDGIDLALGPGETIAVTGPSGSGKSTLVKLLLGLERPEAGAVRLAGRPLDAYDLADWRRSVGVVMQASPLFAGSVAANIAGPAGASYQEVEAAARGVGLDRDRARLPRGLGTPVDPARGVPGALHQQIVLARALIRRPPVLLLDEATNVMDSDILRLVMASLKALDIASVHISHRLTSLAMADRIYVLQGGRVVECGPFTRLLATNGPFIQLYRGELISPQAADRDAERR